ncbi:MAG: TolC family protein [Deltaproteobacteria bacterium]|nr:TolC family protein [Deltaproteobacteria bacterium]
MAFGEPILTIDQAVEEALQENPALKAQEASVNAAKANIGVSKSLDDPTVDVMLYQVPISTYAPNQAMDINYTLTQKFPFPGKLKQKKRGAENMFKAELSGYNTQRLVTQVHTEHAFHELYLAEKSLTLTRQLKSLFAKLASSEGARYAAAGKTSQDYLKSKAEMEMLESEAALLDAEKTEARAMLNILRHKDPGEDIRIADLPRHDHPFPDYREFEEIVLKKHPELKTAEHRLNARKADTSFAKKEASLPNLQISGSYVQRKGTQDAWTADAMINIPFLWEKNRKALHEARAREHQAKQQLASQQDQRLAALKEAYARFENNKKSYAIYRAKVLPSMSVAMKAAQAAYETGNTSFIDFIDTAREYKKAEFATLKAFVDYHAAISDLKYAVGEDFMPSIMDRGPRTEDHGPRRKQ